MLVSEHATQKVWYGTTTSVPAPSKRNRVRFLETVISIDRQQPLSKNRGKNLIRR